MRPLGVAAVVAAVTAVAEIAVFVLVAKAIGVPWTLAVVVATSILGGWLLRREGVRGWRRLRAALSEGRAPGDEASAGLVGVAGALLLVLPGFLTDVAGLLLLTPPVRRFARRGVRVATERRVSSALAGGVFGPRRVRAYRGQAAPEPGPPTAPPSSTTPVRPTSPHAIEGEVIEPDERA